MRQSITINAYESVFLRSKTDKNEKKVKKSEKNR
jgi:hypothetical protein